MSLDLEGGVACREGWELGYHRGSLRLVWGAVGYGLRSGVCRAGPGRGLTMSTGQAWTCSYDGGDRRPTPAGGATSAAREATVGRSADPLTAWGRDAAGMP